MASNQQPLKSQKQLANEQAALRQYQSIWIAIKKAKMGEEVAVRCHKDNAARITQAVKKEKTKEVAVKKALEMPRQGPLVIRKEMDANPESQQCTIFFSLQYDGTKL